MTRLGKLGAVLVTLLLSGCLGSEIGNPPFQPEPATDPGVDLMGVSVTINPMHRGTQLEFDPVALVPSATRLFITPLEGTDPTEVASVASEERLVVPFRVRPDDEIRLQVEVDGVRRAPVDVVADGDLVLHLVTPALGDCLLLESRDLLINDGLVELRIKNECAEAVSFLTPRTRLSSAAFVVTGDLEGLGSEGLAPNEVVSLQVASTGSEGPEEVLFIEATTPGSDRRPITLRRE